MTETVTGTDRSAGISFADLLDQDSHPVSDVLRRESRNVPPGNTRVPAHVYFSKEWHDLEVEKLWSRVWQWACLEDEIPNAGDYFVYDIAQLSFLIVRQPDMSIKAYRNACLHRGRKLRTCEGKGAKNLRCAFHGWSWNLEGSVKEIPCEWDFPDIDTADYGLPEAKVGTWQGFVFINPDRNAEPLDDFLGDLADHFTHLPFTKRYKAAHVAKIMPVNWKACQEAFMESYHTVATHPTLMENLGDANTRYDAYDNYSRAISPHAVESPHLIGMPHYERLSDGLQFARWRHPMNGHIYQRLDLGRVEVTDLDGNVSIFDDEGIWIEGPQTQADPHLCKWIGGTMLPGMEQIPLMLPDPPAAVAAGGPGAVRAWIAEQRRTTVQQQYGGRINTDQVSDAEMLDAMYYSVFPNWSPWGCFHNLMYRFRPNGDDPNSCIFEISIWPPAPDPDNRPAPAKVVHLGVDDDWMKAAVLGPIVKVFQQDSLNLPHVQTGLKAQEQQEVIFASYNETKIRHFYAHLFKWLEVEAVPLAIRPR
jgi:phenylpropionate dioxygenase-like ring-hydroxylating dioxygenase large terminal subunit